MGAESKTDIMQDSMLERLAQRFGVAVGEVEEVYKDELAKLKEDKPLITTFLSVLALSRTREKLASVTEDEPK